MMFDACRQSARAEGAADVYVATRANLKVTQSADIDMLPASGR
jgi:hypothetical protein